MKLNYNLTINETQKNIQVPTSWSDLTLGQVLELFELNYMDKKIRIKVLTILTGLSLDEINQLSGTANINKLNAIESSITFINNEPNFKEFILTKTILLKGKELKIPIDLTKETFGQKVAAEELIRLSPKNKSGDIDILTLMPEILSIYLYPIFSNETFKDERVEYFIPLMKEISIKDAYPIASFFLIKRGIFYKTNLQH